MRLSPVSQRFHLLVDRRATTMMFQNPSSRLSCGATCFIQNCERGSYRSCDRSRQVCCTDQTASCKSTFRLMNKHKCIVHWPEVRRCVRFEPRSPYIDDMTGRCTVFSIYWYGSAQCFRWHATSINDQMAARHRTRFLRDSASDLQPSQPFFGRQL
jgi:hypothetical protein